MNSKGGPFPLAWIHFLLTGVFWLVFLYLLAAVLDSQGRMQEKQEKGESVVPGPFCPGAAAPRLNKEPDRTTCYLFTYKGPQGLTGNILFQNMVVL